MVAMLAVVLFLPAYAGGLLLGSASPASDAYYYALGGAVVWIGLR